jgi:hypothetical protein
MGLFRFLLRANIPNDDIVITLEHVLPEEPQPGTWEKFSAEQRQLLTTRLGNLALLKFSDNSNLQSKEFAGKKSEFKKSKFKLTSELGSLSNWTPDVIVSRQKRLAKLAVKAWPLKF